MKTNEYSRRKFLRQLAGGGAAYAGAAVFLHGCANGNSTETKAGDGAKAVSADPCNDFTAVSEAELEKRRKFGYVDKSPEAGKNCSNCGLYLAWENEKACGGCLLFKGPVHAEGYCMQWAAKAQTS